MDNDRLIKRPFQFQVDQEFLYSYWGGCAAKVVLVRVIDVVDVGLLEQIVTTQTVDTRPVYFDDYDPAKDKGPPYKPVIYSFFGSELNRMLDKSVPSFGAASAIDVTFRNYEAIRENATYLLEKTSRAFEQNAVLAEMIDSRVQNWLKRASNLFKWLSE